MTLGTFQGKPAEPDDPTGIRAALVDAVHDITDDHPRTQQRALGPSQIGEPCARQIAYRMSPHPMVSGRRHDPWPSFLGTAGHARLDEALQAQNRKAGRQIWLTESRTYIPGVRDGGSGSSDAFHIPTGTVVDFKILGDTTYREIQVNGPGQGYAVQIHTYGLGQAAAGWDVRNVALAVFGRAKPLSRMFVWSDVFRPQLAADALDRVRRIRYVVDQLRLGQDGNRLDVIPATPGKGCFYCPFRGDAEHGFCEETKA